MGIGYSYTPVIDNDLNEVKGKTIHKNLQNKYELMQSHFLIINLTMIKQAKNTHRSRDFVKALPENQ